MKIKKKTLWQTNKRKHVPNSSGQSFKEVIFPGNLNIFPLISSSRLLLSTWGLTPNLPECATVGIKALNS